MTRSLDVLLALSSLGALYALYELRRRRQLQIQLQLELEATKKELEHEKTKREAERKGRIKHERELMELRHQQVAAAGPADGKERGGEASTSEAGLSYPLTPIGFVRSVYNMRNGAPRQALLVTESRAVLDLTPDIPMDCLDGLGAFTHCWVIYIFHKNTDLHRLWSAPGRRVNIKGKIRVPRLNGGRMGVLATRTPHRPCPVGLSVARIVSVKGSRIVLGGVDLVDGTPVLDIKPYVPFADSIPGAVAPDWVAAEAPGEEPLAVSRIDCDAGAWGKVQEVWEGVDRGRSRLHGSFDEFRAFVEQVLRLDFRSAYQRLKSGADPVAAAPASQGLYRLVVDDVDIGYDVGLEGGSAGSKVVVVRGARVPVQEAGEAGEGEGKPEPAA